MNKHYVIQWKSKVNGRSGRGTKQFNREDAERLVEDLNHEYPQIEHGLLEIQAAAPPPATDSPAANPAPTLSIA